jgi:hypothetical protein
MLLGSEVITVKKLTSGAIVDGYAQPPTVVTETIEATVRPMTGRDLEILESGDRVRDPRKIYTKDLTLKAGDLVTIDGFDYEVSPLKDNSRHGFLQHYEFMALKLRTEV